MRQTKTAGSYFQQVAAYNAREDASTIIGNAMGGWQKKNTRYVEMYYSISFSLIYHMCSKKRKKKSWAAQH